MSQTEKWAIDCAIQFLRDKGMKAERWSEVQGYRPKVNGRIRPDLLVNDRLLAEVKGRASVRLFDIRKTQVEGYDLLITVQGSKNLAQVKVYDIRKCKWDLSQGRPKFPHGVIKSMRSSMQSRTAKAWKKKHGSMKGWRNRPGQMSKEEFRDLGENYSKKIYGVMAERHVEGSDHVDRHGRPREVKTRSAKAYLRLISLHKTEVELLKRDPLAMLDLIVADRESGEIIDMRSFRGRDLTIEDDAYRMKSGDPILEGKIQA